MFSANVGVHDVSACRVDAPGKVAGGVNVRLQIHPLVMVRCDEHGDRGAVGVHWWAADFHNACVLQAGWVDKEGRMGECLAEGGFDEKDSSGWIDYFLY